MNSFKPQACSSLTARSVRGLELRDPNDGVLTSSSTYRDNRSPNISWSEKVCPLQADQELQEDQPPETVKQQ